MLGVAMFSDSEPECEGTAVEQAASQAAHSGGLVATQAAESWVAYVNSVTESSRAKLGRQARPLLVYVGVFGYGDPHSSDEG